MRRVLDDGFELDDAPARIDIAAVHAFLSGESYWGRGRTLELVQRAIAGSTRVVGLYREREQIGFARAVSDGAILAYMADVYVLDAYRGRGLGVALVRELIDVGPLAGLLWMLHTRDAQGMYEKLGFREGPLRYAVMERAREDTPQTYVEDGADRHRGL